ncbi:MAG: nucleotide exchange factor GrpE [Rhodothermales bacterium]
MIEYTEPIRGDEPPAAEGAGASRPAVETAHFEPSAAEGHVEPSTAEAGSPEPVHTATGEGDEASSAAEGFPDVLAAEPHQAHRRLLDLALQMNRLEAQVDRLLAETQHSGTQVAVLTRHLTSPEAIQPLNERLANLMSRMEGAQAQLEELTRTVTRMNRVQFKSNTLSEGKEQQVVQALTILQEIATRREQITEAQRLEQQQHLADERAAARVVFAVDLLPVLDGLERAVESGQVLLERKHAPGGSPSSTRRGLWRTVRTILAGTSSPDSTIEIRTALAAWLQGLELVRGRFLELLTLENIQPIPALDQPFDPRLHVATSTEVRSDVQPGTIIRVLRRGYSHGPRVLRYAEVVVACAPTTPNPAQAPKAANIATHEERPQNLNPDV